MDLICNQTKNSLIVSHHLLFTICVHTCFIDYSTSGVISCTSDFIMFTCILSSSHIFQPPLGALIFIHFFKTNWLVHKQWRIEQTMSSSNADVDSDCDSNTHSSSLLPPIADNNKSQIPRIQCSSSLIRVLYFNCCVSNKRKLWSCPYKPHSKLFPICNPLSAVSNKTFHTLSLHHKKRVS